MRVQINICSCASCLRSSCSGDTLASFLHNTYRSLPQLNDTDLFLEESTVFYSTPSSHKRSKHKRRNWWGNLFFFLLTDFVQYFVGIKILMEKHKRYSIHTHSILIDLTRPPDIAPVENFSTFEWKLKQKKDHHSQAGKKNCPHTSLTTAP